MTPPDTGGRAAERLTSGRMAVRARCAPATRAVARRRARAGAYVAVAALAVAAGLAACDPISTFEPDPDTIPREQIIDLTRAGGRTAALRADGVSNDTLLAHLPKGATSRLVTFSTTAGTFPLTGAREAKIRAEPDPTDGAGRLVARVVLRADRADTLAGAAVASALVGEFRDTLSVQITR